MAKSKPLTPSDIIIFGGMGDLAIRKILPALFHRFIGGQFSGKGKVILIGRNSLKRNHYIEEIKNKCEEYVGKESFKPNIWNKFAGKILYIKMEAEIHAEYSEISNILAKTKVKGRVFYLATPSEIFGIICHNLKNNNLITQYSRVVLEKPLGKNLKSFKKINNDVLDCFNEKQIYRIDHYLGKETVQNLMIIRFANNIFAEVWNKHSIEHVQITVSETLGVGNRLGYFDKAGALRDMVQNHLLQLLCLVAMEPPNAVDADSIRDEKLKVLKALKPFSQEDIKKYCVRGQYATYRKESGKKRSNTETFVALKLMLDNWRWSGVPFYLKTGKCLNKRYSEIVLQFKPVPHHIFPGQSKDPETNKLIIRLQPDESVKLEMVTKIPGPGGYRLKRVYLNLSLADVFGEQTSGAYERLLMDVVRGNQTLFMRSDEVEAAWRWVDSIIEGWKKMRKLPLLYKAGSRGPRSALMLMKKDRRQWHETQ